MSLTKYRYSIQDETGLYYIATQSPDTSWTVTTRVDPYYLKHLPKGWNKMEISWERDLQYFGVFRSMTNNFEFPEDGRAILMNLLYNSGIQAYGLLIIEMLQETESTPGAADQWRYEVVYQSEFDFKGAKDFKRTGFFQIKTLDSRLFELLKAWGSTDFNIPLWTYDSGGSTWITDGKFFVHDGIKLLYQADFISGATASSTLNFRSPNDIVGFHHGAIGNSAHTIPAMNPYNIVQNNGTTTYIGNDILQPFLIQGSQAPGQYHVINEIDFNNAGGSPNSMPYSQNKFCIKNILDNGSGTVEMHVRVQGQFAGTIDVGATSPDPFIGFVLFEIGADDLPPASGSVAWLYTTILKYMLPASPFSGYAPPSGGVFDSGLVPVTLQYNKVYVLSIIHDGVASTGIGLGASAAFELSDLRLSFASKYNSGSGAAVVAPHFPASPCIGFRPHQMLEKIVPCLNSTQTDAYGFPIIPGSTPYAGVSTFLSNSLVPYVYDSAPYATLLTSRNALSLINGQPYISMSLQRLYKMCFNFWGCGLSIDGDNVRIEDMGYYFDAGFRTFDLGTNVADLSIEQLTDFGGCSIKAGYSSPDTNNDFGCESIHREMDYTTPLTKLAKTVDYKESDVIADQYAAEKARAQQSNQPIQSPSSSNETYIFEIDPDITHGYILPDTVDGQPVQVYDPGRNAVGVSAYALRKYAGAQNSDPTAASAPYVYGCFYPEDALNLGITPSRNIYRNGGLLHSMLDYYDSNYITFRKQYQMQYDNSAIPLPGIKSNLDVGAAAAVIDEVADVPISSLATKYFRPYILNVTTSFPVNAYAIINGNPNGYIQFTWKGTDYKGFIWKIKMLSDQASTQIQLLAHPSTSNADLLAV